MKYAYHNIHLETALNYKEDCQSILWPIKSPKNNQKVQTFSLGPKRSVNFVVSATGTVNISIDCTYKPYEFHTSTGLMSFFGTCGQILTYLQLSTKNRTNVVPDFDEWYLTRFDYNKDLLTKDLKDKYDTKVISWSSKGRLKLKHIGTIFQIYCKEMPYLGECLRAEGHFSTKEKVKLKSMIPNLVAADSKGKHPFTTIEEMLIQRRSNGMLASPTLQKVKSAICAVKFDSEKFPFSQTLDPYIIEGEGCCNKSNCRNYGYG